MEDYKAIRQLYLDGASERSIAKKLHISRGTVAKYKEGNSMPWQRKTPERSPSVLTQDMVKFIESCLEEDKREGVPKQKHTAKRIYERLKVEKSFPGCESTVRGKVNELRQPPIKCFIPLAFSPGEAMQIDWGEATAYVDGSRIKLNLFCARLCSSSAPFVAAFRRQNEESFQEALVRSFEFFGGTTRKVIFDNGKVAVKSGYGAQAVKQAGYDALCAHYAFDALFCNPSAGHEKGLVEGLVGWARRNIMVPVPRVPSLDELNKLLAERCMTYRSHKIQGKEASVGEMLSEERLALRPLPGHPFETAKRVSCRVDSFGVARYDTNSYSVPHSYAGKEVSVKAYAETIVVFFKGQQIASHKRSFGKYQSVYRLEHYLPILERRGRAIFNAKPVRENLPPEFLNWLQKEAFTHKELVEILYSCVDKGYETVWKNLVLPKEEVIKDIVVVSAVDLQRYDRLIGAKAGVCDVY